MNGECLVLIIILIIEMRVENNIYGVSSLVYIVYQ
jgi:hypothetical protein